jgi:hypothetical protein
MPTPIEVLWEDLRQNNERPVFRRIDETHSLDLYAGIDSGDARILMLIAPEEPPPPAAYDAIIVTSRRRTDGMWVLVIELKAKDLAVPFARLCQDLVDATRGCAHGGASVLLNRLDRWRRLMDLAGKEVLPEHVLRGLLGELIILHDSLAPRFTISAAVNAWVGPDDAPQDFVLAGIAVEVKTCTPAATFVRISSLEQLDADCPLFLATVRLTTSSHTQSAAFTPAQLVASIRSELGENAPSRAEFDLRLAEAGYQDLPAYGDKWYQWDGTRYFRVIGDFPRLTAATVPTGIAATSYDVALNICAPYEIAENELWN